MIARPVAWTAIPLATLMSGCTTPIAAVDAFVPPDVPSIDAGIDAGEASDAGVDAGAPDTPTTDARLGDAGLTDGPRADAPFTGEELVYVVDAFHLPSAPEGPDMDVAPGVNLDGAVSDGSGSDTCVDFVPDLQSPSGELGIDNQLVGSFAALIEGLLKTTLQAQLDAALEEGRFVMALRITELSSLADDADVTAEIYLVKAEDCTADTCALPTGVTAGETWLARETAIATSSSARIEAGRLVASFDDLPFPVDVFGPGSELPMRDAVIVGTVSATSFTEASMSGSLTVDDLVAASASTGIEPETVRSLLAGFTDLDPSAADPQVCDAMSAGIGLRGVDGTLVIE